MKNNIHHDYDPIRIVSYINSSVVRGIIVKVRFRKRRNLTFLQKCCIVMCFLRNKDIYFWLPYKYVVEASGKYDIIGGKARDPYAKQWFEVKEISEIYKQGLSNFALKEQKIHKHTNELRLTPPFLASELLTLSRKKVIKMLDSFLFHPNETAQSKVRKIQIKYKHKSNCYENK